MGSNYHPGCSRELPGRTLSRPSLSGVSDDGHPLVGCEVAGTYASRPSLSGTPARRT